MGTPALPATETTHQSPERDRDRGETETNPNPRFEGRGEEEREDPRTVLEHLEKREGGDVDLLGGVEQRRVRRRLPHAGGAEDPLQPLHLRSRRLALLSSLASAGFVRFACD